MTCPQKPSSNLACRAGTHLPLGLQNGASDLLGQLSAANFQFRAGGLDFRLDAPLGAFYLFVGVLASLLKRGATFIQCLAPQHFLFAKKFSSGFAQCFLICAGLFVGVPAQFFSLAPGAFNAFRTLPHDLLNGSKKRPPAGKVGQKSHYRRWYCREKKIAELS